MTTPITCTEADALRPGLRPLSSLTNFVGGAVLNPELPPRTATTWGREDDTEVLRDELDTDGCRHYLLEGDPA